MFIADSFNAPLMISSKLSFDNKGLSENDMSVLRPVICKVVRAAHPVKHPLNPAEEETRDKSIEGLIVVSFAHPENASTNPLSAGLIMFEFVMFPTISRRGQSLNIRSRDISDTDFMFGKVVRQFDPLTASVAKRTAFVSLYITHISFSVMSANPFNEYFKVSLS